MPGTQRGLEVASAVIAREDDDRIVGLTLRPQGRKYLSDAVIELLDEVSVGAR